MMRNDRVWALVVLAAVCVALVIVAILTAR
jgi:hypothetical protein